jgi:hypothetical protein
MVPAETDAGVHAEGQVASVELKRDITPQKLRNAINGNLPGDLRVLFADAVAENFSRALFRAQQDVLLPHCARPGRFAILVALRPAGGARVGSGTDAELRALIRGANMIGQRFPRHNLTPNRASGMFWLARLMTIGARAVIVISSNSG